MKNTLFLICLIALLSFSVSAVRLSIISPTANSVIAGTGTFIAEVNMTPGEGNVTVWGLNVSTANGANVLCSNSSTARSNDSVFNITCQYATTSSPENMSININYTLTNQTIVSNTSRANYSINNSLPSANFTTGINTQFAHNGVLNASVGDEVSSCTFFFNTRSFTGTKAGSACTYTITRSNPPDGSYNVRLQVDDGFGSSDTFQSYRVLAAGGSVVILNPSTTSPPTQGGAPLSIASVQVGSNSINPLWIIAGVILMFVIFGRKK